jgi:DNA polymerase
MSIDYNELDKLQQKHVELRCKFTSLSPVFVPGEGDSPQAFIIGEAPGAQEEIQRRPFVGPSGHVLRDLMATVRLYAHPSEKVVPNCWMTNVVKFRPPRNRKPLFCEINAMRELLQLEWQAVGAPRLIIPVGSTALTAIYGRPMSILKTSGKMLCNMSKGGKELYLFPMIHPSFGLRNPGVRPLIERDWDTLKQWMTYNDWLK